MTDLYVRGHATELRPLNGRKLLHCTRCGRTGPLCTFMSRCTGKASQFSAVIETHGDVEIVHLPEPSPNVKDAPALAGAPTTTARPRCTTNEDRTPEQ